MTTLLLTLAAPVRAQQEEKPLGVWLLGGAGLMSTLNTEGVGVTLQLTAQRRPHQLTLRVSGGGGINSSAGEFGDAGLLYGRALIGRVGHVSASAGPGIAVESECRSCDRELSPALLVSAEANLRVLPTIGLGAQLLGNGSRFGAMIGLIVTLQFGWMPGR